MLKWSVSSVSTVSVQNNQKMSAAPQPRLCHIKKWKNFDGFGFTLQSDKADGSQIIGKIEENSPAAAGGLKARDKIIEIDGVNVTRENHKQVVERIRTGGGETRLLVADQECQDYHDDQDIVIRSSLPYILHLSSEQDEHTSSEEEEEEEPRESNNNHEDIDSDEGVEELSNDLEEAIESEEEDTKDDSSDEEPPTPRDNPASQYQPQSISYNKDELVAGLNLNMTAKEMRERVGSVKKTDPRISQIDLREKYK